MAALKSALLTPAALHKSTPAKRRASLASKSRLNPTTTNPTTTTTSNANTTPTLPTLTPIIRTSHTSTKHKHHINSDSNYISTGEFSARRRTHRVIHRNNHSEAIKRKVNCVKQYGYATITTNNTSNTTASDTLSSSTSYKRCGGIGSVLGRAVYYPSKDVFSLHPPSFNITAAITTSNKHTTHTTNSSNSTVYNTSNSISHMYLTEEQLDDLIPDPRPDPTTADDVDNEGEGVADYTGNNYDRYDDDGMTNTGMTTADHITSYSTNTTTANTTDSISLSHSFAENEILGLKLMFSLFDR